MLHIDLSYHGAKTSEELDHIVSLSVGNTWEHLERLNKKPPSDGEYPVVVLDECLDNFELGRTMILSVTFAKWLVNDYWKIPVDFEGVLKRHEGVE